MTTKLATLVVRVAGKYDENEMAERREERRRTEGCPDGTLTQYTVPDHGMEAEALCRDVLIDHERVLVTVVNDLPVALKISERQPPAGSYRGGASYAWKVFFSPDSLNSLAFMSMVIVFRAFRETKVQWNKVSSGTGQ